MGKRTTIRDVAKAANVSTTTVSHALNGHGDVNENTRSRIVEIAEKLNYIPNENSRALKGKNKKTIAFMIAGKLPANDLSGITFGLMSGIYSVTEERGCEFEILTAPVSDQMALSFNRLCLKKNVSGVAVYGLATDMPYFSEIPQSEIPCILVDVELAGKNIREVSIDNERASFEMVEHLIEQGCRNIAMISGRDVAQVSKLREAGYRAALKKHGITIREEWIVPCDFDYKISTDVSIELKRDYPEIDAFFCASDNMAIGAFEGMEKLGISVPGDVAVAGFDDYPITRYVGRGITSVKQYPYEMGVACADAIFDLLDGKEVNEWIEAKYLIQKRNSTDRGGR